MENINLKERVFFEKNSRLGMLVRTFDQMNSHKQNAHLKTADEFLEQI